MASPVVNGGQPTDARIVKSRAAALAAARRLFLDGGFDAITHQNVAREAGIGRATVYRHWPERNALLVDTVADMLADSPPIESEDPTQRAVQRLQRLRDRLDSDMGSVMAELISRARTDGGFAELRDTLIQPEISGLEADLQRLGVPSHRLRAQAAAGAIFVRRFVLGISTGDNVIRRLLDL